MAEVIVGVAVEIGITARLARLFLDFHDAPEHVIAVPVAQPELAAQLVDYLADLRALRVGATRTGGVGVVRSQFVQRLARCCAGVDEKSLRVLPRSDFSNSLLPR